MPIPLNVGEVPVISGVGLTSGIGSPVPTMITSCVPSVAAPKATCKAPQARALASVRGAAETVRDFYLEFGGTSLGGPEGAAVIDILDTIEVVLHQRRYVIGVHEAPDRETALALAERIRKRLQEIGDDGS